MNNKKQILILGGTQFVGRHLSEWLQQSEHHVTLFHRGKTHPELFPEFRHLLGDRLTSDIGQIYGQDWDVVVDFSCYYPRLLKAQVAALNGRVGRYIFVSTVSVYDLDSPGEGLINESTPTLSCSLEQEIDTSLMTYGQRKAACERVLLDCNNLNSVIFRPGLIYGPYDPTDRAYYWLWRTHTQKQMIVPEPQIRQQWTFAPDFARMLGTAALGAELPGTVYLALTHEPYSLSEMLMTMGQVCRRDVQQIPVTADWMEAHGLQFWQDISLSMPYERLFDMGAWQQACAFACTPYADTWCICKDYYAQQGWSVPGTGISIEREIELLHTMRGVAPPSPGKGRDVKHSD